jgi:hypothetical protein
MEDVFMNTVLIHTGDNFLSLSLRIVRLMTGVILVVAITMEMSLSDFWKLPLSILAIYSFVTGLFGRDPLFSVLKLSVRQLPNHALGVMAQLECLFVGLVCIALGIMNRHADSLLLQLLPFLGIYPILLCGIKHDLLGYLVQSYRKDIHTKNRE